MIGTQKEVAVWLLDQPKDKMYKIEEHKEKRSLTSNAYCWCLLSKIATVLRTSKEEVYLEMLKRYGQHDMISVLAKVDVSKYLKYYEEAGRSILQGKEFVHYKIYRGSSEYNSAEMAAFLDGIVSEAEHMHIETLPPDELLRLKAMWKA